MFLYSYALRRTLFVTAMFVALAPPVGAQEPYSYTIDSTEVGAPYTAYRAGIGHTEASLRPLDGTPRAQLPPKPVTDWSGFYFGASAGGVLGTTDLDGGINTGIDVDGFSLSGHAGKNWQIGSVVFGVELDAATTSAEGSQHTVGTVTTKIDLDWLSSARLRAGYA